jgi:transcriptional regulator with XRE-family HTH domain
MPRHKGHGSKPEWFNERGEVESHQLHAAERAVFIEWFALPEAERDPSTQKALAEELGVSANTISTWKKDLRIMAAVRGTGQAAVLGSFGDITQSMVAIAKDPDHKSAVPAARLLFEMLEKSEKSIDTVPLADMTDDEMRELMGEMYDIFDARTDDAETA